MQVVLEVIEGTQAGRRFEFDRHDTFMVGRSRKVHFCIPDDGYFSRFHFMVEANPPQCFLRDLGSTNGTKVNGETVEQAYLTDGDVIKAGHSLIRVHVVHSPPPAPPEPPADETAPPVAPPRGPRDLTGTVISGRVPAPGQAGELHCALCNAAARAEETLLADLTDTRMATYVCRKCRQRHCDPQHPIPNFELLAELGSGALGPVHKARRLSTGALVALKTFPPELAQDRRAVRLFLREMELSARLEHPNIASLVEVGDAGGDLWLASQYVDGLDAAKLAHRLGGTVPLADAVEIICQTLAALQYAHDRNLVHRDVKPANILVTGPPGAYQARLADFGLMKNVDEAGLTGITRAKEVRGTPSFMPPEQVLDSRFVKPVGDLYQAGASLYWLLTGQFVYDFAARDRRGEIKDAFLIILEDPVVPIRQRDAGIPEAVAEAIGIALAREPDDRYESADEMTEALRAAAS